VAWPALYGECKSDFKQRKKSALSKPAANNHNKESLKELRGIGRSTQPSGF